MAARSDCRSWGHSDSLHLLVLECVKEIIVKVLFQGPANSLALYSAIIKMAAKAQELLY